ncbi:beta/gamma crystallin domain-containing protein [Streptomyces sp. B3I8]|uniref:beta/gamma crystallin domain-containing protein n=1 Tax=Streptomyces sp. B3I8 TaxID=3042303 RepID=UPI00278508C1|nr:beta/gamma crystallin domain-containing protein [Streptomyces sp. B3I8]MDQ0786574.1 hypothetical protein [Streptomyces sp. B3I8]
MKRSARRAVLAGLASAALMTSLSVGATSASALSIVKCDSPDYLKVTVHGGVDGGLNTWCYANAGEIGLADGVWMTKIETGNNRVQWYGDNRWQPAQPIGKWTTFTWPSFPGGVSVNRIKIV